MRFQCPKCNGIVDVDPTLAGSQVQCGHCNQAVSVPSDRLAPGVVVGDFVIKKELSRGGMGIVFLAHQISLDRPAALKILNDAYTDNEEFVTGLVREARAAAKLNHPNIVQAYAVGEDEGLFYFAMEYIDGETMKSVLKREKTIKPERAAEVIEQIAEALKCAWNEQKLVHHDIKPENIMLTSSGQAKLADLGLSQVAGESTEDDDSDEVMGTPQYISPEQLTGEPSDNRSDLYSLGATFYHLVTGRFPYEGAEITDITRQHVEGNLTPPKKINPLLPDALDRIIVKMMKRPIDERYQSAEDLITDLKQFLGGKMAPGGNLDHGLHAGAAPLAGGLRQGGMRTIEAPGHASGEGPKISMIQPKPVQPPIQDEAPAEEAAGEPEEAPAMLSAETEQPAGPHFTLTPEEEPVRKKSALPAVLLVLLLLAVLGGGGFWFWQQQSKKPAEPAAAPSPEPAEPAVPVVEPVEETEPVSKFAPPELPDDPQAATEEYRKNLTPRWRNLIANMMQFASENDAAGAKEMFQTTLAERPKLTPEGLKEAATFRASVSELQKAFDTGYRLTMLITDSGSELKDTPIEIGRGELVYIESIANGVMTVRHNDGALSQEAFQAIRPAYQEGFFKRLDKRLHIDYCYFFYLLYHAEFNADLTRLPMPAFWKRQLPTFEGIYYQERWKNADETEKQQLHQQYGRLRSFAQAINSISYQ